MDGCHGKEAWVGGKPNHQWTGLETPNVVDFPQPSQMQLSNAKAATSHLKRAKGVFVEEACRFKTGEDLDDPCARLKTHFRKHRMDTITHRNNPNEEKQMVSAFNLHLLFTVKSTKACNVTLRPECNTHDKQNDDNATKCFMNSLGEDLRRQI